MCGIAGILSRDCAPEKSTLARMASFMKERGPENTGYLIHQNVGLVHTRLSIIDLSAKANQPMQNSQGEIALVCNGEVYNFRELKNELVEAGKTFSTQSDTEVIIEGYQHWGIQKLLQKIDGMFAFVLVDFQAQVIHFARDPFGKKPLYIYKTKKQIVFSSSIQSIWDCKKTDLTLNTNSLDYYLSEVACPQPHTIWSEIEQAKPAHFNTLEMKNWKWSEESYWSLPTKNQLHPDETELLNEIEEVLTSAILKRTVADVPIGCFLSGGIDSGLISSILASNSSKPIRTFSVGFDSSELNELPEARLVAERYQTDHHEIIMDSNTLDILPSMIEYIGEPFADMSMLPTYHISRYLGETVKVALSGDGGDELFGGYHNYSVAFRAEELIKKHPNLSIRNIAIILDKIKSRFRSTQGNLGEFAEFLNKKPHEKLYRHIGFGFLEKEDLYGKKSDLVPNNFGEKWLSQLWHETPNNNGLTDQTMRASLNTRLLNSYLVKVDRSSMKNSLEVRSPFLDKDLANLAFSISSSWKFKNQQPKYLLKQLAKKYIDPAIDLRPKKGFGVPMNDWIIQQKPWVISMLNDSKIFNQNFFDKNYIQNLITSPKPEDASKIWCLVCLGLWSETYL